MNMTQPREWCIQCSPATQQNIADSVPTPFFVVCCFVCRFVAQIHSPTPAGFATEDDRATLGRTRRAPPSPQQNKNSRPEETLESTPAGIRLDVHRCSAPLANSKTYRDHFVYPGPGHTGITTSTTELRRSRMIAGDQSQKVQRRLRPPNAARKAHENKGLLRR